MWSFKYKKNDFRYRELFLNDDDDATICYYPTPVDQSSNDFGSSPTTLPSENADELCKLQMKIHVKRSGNATKSFDEEYVAESEKLLEFRCSIPTHHKESFDYITFFKIVWDSK